MERIIELGAVAYDNEKGIRRNPVTLDVRLSDDNVFSMTGCIWKADKTDTIVAGQCIDTIAKLFPDNTLVARLYTFWKKYHLNDLHAGTPAQEKALQNAGFTSFANDFGKCCGYLESIGLYNDHGYKFGSGWLKQEIPEDDLNEIKEIILNKDQKYC